MRLVFVLTILLIILNNTYSQNPFTHERFRICDAINSLNNQIKNSEEQNYKNADYNHIFPCDKSIIELQNGLILFQKSYDCMSRYVERFIAITGFIFLGVGCLVQFYVKCFDKPKNNARVNPLNHPNPAH